MAGSKDLFLDIEGEAGCLRLSRDFYARVASDPDLRTLFPGKSLRCATEEFAAFLVQFFDGDESRMQYRWWLSLRESHACFQISESQRSSWLSHMNATLDSSSISDELRVALGSFFNVASTYIVNSNLEYPANPELAELWQRQLSLDRLIEAIVAGRDAEAIALASHHASRRSVTVGILARMMETGREPLVDFALNSLERDASLARARFNGRVLMHFAAGSGCLPVLLALLNMGEDPNVLDQGKHSPLYRAANECGKEVGAQIVCELVRRGACVDHAGGVTRSTPLHAAARRGHQAIAMALIDEGASMEVRDYKGFSPLDRARNCRKLDMAVALESRMIASNRPHP
ncbi:MAG: hypothetical protein H7Y17_10680 [Chlorobia bacterium]|nr:hypothetical protein [Fimbriimonadaceae bacterium]